MGATTPDRPSQRRNAIPVAQAGATADPKRVGASYFSAGHRSRMAAATFLPTTWPVRVTRRLEAN